MKTLMNDIARSLAILAGDFRGTTIFQDGGDLGERYAVTNEIYPPEYSVIKLIGDTGYSHVKSFRRKKDAIEYIKNIGGVLTEYQMAEGGKVSVISDYRYIVSGLDKEGRYVVESIVQTKRQAKERKKEYLKRPEVHLVETARFRRSQLAKGGQISDERVDRVLQSYMEAALWSSTDDEGEPLDANYDFDDIPESEKDKMRRDIRKFIRDNEALIEGSGMSDDQLGHDLWLTRNHHGAGFWDRGYDEYIGDGLTASAQALGQSDIYVGDDEQVYIMAKGGKIASARARDRKYTSHQPHEQRYKSKRKSRVRYYMAEGGQIEDWQEVALRELREEEDNDELEITDSDISYVGSRGMTVEGADYTEYIAFENDDEAEQYAVQQVEEQLESEPELFTQDWLMQHVDEDAYLDALESDLRMWVEESPESYTGFINDEEPEDDDEYSEDQIERMVEGYKDDIKNQGVMEWLRGELGYEGESLFGQINPYLDIKAAAQDTVDTDGVAHFLASYDGDQIDLPSGAVAYRTN